MRSPPSTTMLQLLLLYLLLLVVAAVSGETSPADVATMHELSTSLSAASALRWSRSVDPCSWPLVSCSAGRVTAIHIANKSLSGTLPSSISKLTALTTLELQSNLISGDLPSLAGLSSLQTLLLHSNRFTSIPSNFFTGLSSLQSVSLDDNPFLSWKLPASLGDATALVNFSANSVNLTGGFPDVFAGEGFPGLHHLGLAYNSLSGPLPAGLSRSPVTSLWLNNQQGKNGLLSGGIGVITNMSNLVQLWLQSNDFSGPLPEFDQLVALEDLNLRDNRFSGPVPASLVRLKSLRRVVLTNNLLQGPVPVFGKAVTVDMKPFSERFCMEAPGECDPRVSIFLNVIGAFGYPTGLAEHWQGNDPCDRWGGVECDRTGNISSLNFRNAGLTGTISPDFALFPNLQILVLADNNITGTIPESLTNLQNLRELDLSNNLLYGKVPTFSKIVMVNTTGNVDIGKEKSSLPAPVEGGSSSSSDFSKGPNGDKKPSFTLIGIVVAVLGSVTVLGFLGVMVFYLYRRKHKYSSKVQSSNTTVIHPPHSGSDHDLVKITVASSSMNRGMRSTSVTSANSAFSDVHVIESGNMVISIQVLKNVTNNFSNDNILGQGGFGTVYKGELHDGTKIAVKRMESGVMGSTGLTEFQSEIAVLTKVQHRNLVSLLGYCLDGNERLLVYEYMPQGTLSRYLFNWREEGLKPLEWKKRLGIALDVARGVEYLHTLANQSFIHRDLKPSNILLGDDMKAKVADFGLVRLAPDGKCSVVTRLAGTFGYLAPEYAVTGRVTTKADVFSFGVILMELITGRRALDESQPEENVHLVTWFQRMQLNKESFCEAIDPTIDLEEETLASVSTVSELAGHCCAREPYQRPEMGHAVNVLSSLAEMWKPSLPDLEDMYGIDLDMSLPQALKKWQAFEDNNQSDAATSLFLASVDNTQTSIPTRPSGFADSFTSTDGR